MASEQWYRTDAHFMGKPFTISLMDRFGLAGVAVWQAFLAACKKNYIQGRITFMTLEEAARDLGIYGRKTVDDDGQPWTLTDFFEFTGRMKQTRKTTHGRVQNVTCTHWERWQNAQKTFDARDRKRRSRARNGRDQSVTENEKEKEKENGRVTMSQRGAAPPEPPAYREWARDPAIPPDGLRFGGRKIVDG